MKVRKEPLLLVFQIDPKTCNLIEAAIHFNLTVDGHGSRHERWWSTMTPDERVAAQALVSSAVQGTL